MAKLINAVMVIEYEDGTQGTKGVMLCGGKGQQNCVEKIVQALKDPATGWAYCSADEFILALGEMIERRRGGEC